MGGDALANIKKWKNWDTLLRTYSVIVYERPGFTIDPELSNYDIQILKAPLLQISSTMIRKMIKENQSIRYLVPDIVEEEIHNQGYYL